MELLRNIKGIAIVEFGKQDIIRHRLVQHIIRAFEEQQERSEEETFRHGE